MRASLKAWEDTWKTADPDYPKKAERVYAEMRLMTEAERQANGGTAVSPEKLVEIARAARKKIEAWMAGLQPGPRRMSTVTGGAAAPAAKEPKSALEAAEMALARTRQAA